MLKDLSIQTTTKSENTGHDPGDEDPQAWL